MLLRVIQDRFKEKSGRKFLEDEQKKSRSFSEKKGISTIACIVDMDNYDNAEIFETLRDTLKLNPNAIHVIGFKRNEVKGGMFSIPFVTEKQLGWNGSIDNGNFSEFMGRDYDVLVNYYTDDKLMLKLMSTKVNARIRVGLNGADNDYNDLIFDCPLNDFETFSSELKKYLTILKEIE